MSVRSVLIFCLALVFGAVAVFTARAWLQGQRNALLNVARQVSPAQVPENTIVVANRALRFGDRLQEDYVREIPWPSGTVPKGSFKTKELLLNPTKSPNPGPRFVTSAIELDEPILGWKVTGPGQRATLSATLAEGMKAITIRVNDVLGVAGFVLPGDRVDVLLTRDGGVTVLLQGLKVLAIDQSADDRRNEPAVVKAVTFEVSTEEAQILTLAATVGQLSLALRNIASADVEKTKRVTLADLSDENSAAAGLALAEGGDATTAPPPIARAPAPVAVNVPVAVDTSVRVGVFRPFARTEYRVPAGN